MIKIGFLTRILDFLMPRLCSICGRRLAPCEEKLCTVCNYHLPRTGYHLDSLDNRLARLFWGHFPIERAAAFTFYHSKSMSSRIVYALKYFGRSDIGAFMGRMMAREYLPSGFFEDIDVIMPVPLSRGRRRSRGYNQSEEIARGLSSLTGIPVCTKIVRRTDFRQSQTHLGLWERQENVSGMFVAAKQSAAMAGKHILIVDDIITTGATIMSCAECLKDIPGIRFSVAAWGVAGR